MRRERLRAQRAGLDSLRAWSESKPPINEALDTVKALYVARQFGCALYFVHTTCRLKRNLERDFFVGIELTDPFSQVVE